MHTHRIPVSLRAAVLSFASVLSASAQVPHLLHHQGRVAVAGVNFNGTGQFKFALVDAGTNLSRTATATATVAGGLITSVTVTDGGAGYTAIPSASINDKFGGGAALSCFTAGGTVTTISVLNGGIGYTAAAKVRIDAPPANTVFQTYWSNAVDTSPADGEPDTAVSLAVTNGLFDVLLGNTALPNMAALPSTVFDNPDVRLRVWFDDGSHGFQQLTPDKRIAAVGYAVMAENVQDGAITAGKLADEAVTAAKIATGAVGSTQLAANAVQSGNIATGAIGTAQIANGAITATQLAKPPRSGSITFDSLDVQFNQVAFTVPFSPAFAATPVVTLAARKNSTTPWQPSLGVATVGPASFSGYLSAPALPLTLDSTDDVGQFASMALLSATPCVAYYDATNDNLKFVRASNVSGTAWNQPITLDSSGDVGQYASLAAINAYLAVAYYDWTNHSLKFVRSTTVDGTIWNLPITLDSGGVGQYASLALVNGNPAVAYYDLTNQDLKFIRATDAAGTVWGSPVTVASVGQVGWHASLVVLNGNPAIAYFDLTNTDLKFVRATNASGTTWGTAVTVDSAGDVGRYASLARLTELNPAIAYYDATNSNLKFVCATDISGTAWSPPATVDSTGSVGQYASLAVVSGNPGVAYYDNSNNGLKFVRATNASGTAWGTPAILATGYVGTYPSLIMASGIAYYDSSDGDLKYLSAPDLPTTFAIDWIALEP